MACRICTLLAGMVTMHLPAKLHADAPAIPISRVVTAGLAYIKQQKEARA